VQLDPWLAPFKDALRKRYSKAQDWIAKINQTEGGLEKFSRVSSDSIQVGAKILTTFKSTEKMGFNVDKNSNITYREWAPNATEAFLIGDFSMTQNVASCCRCES
jgi:1,4-alpha-glucan branching enzyme